MAAGTRALSGKMGRQEPGGLVGSAPRKMGSKKTGKGKK